MRRIIKKVYYVNQGWWDSFTSCFIGSLLGIGITFWVSDFLEKRNSKDLERTVQLMNLSYMSDIVDDFKIREEYLSYTDSVFSEVLGYYPDSINYVPEELVDKFYTELRTATVSAENNSVQGMFNNNIEVWQSADDLSVIKTIGGFYTNKDGIDVCLSEMFSIVNKLFYNIGKDNHLSNYDNHTKAISRVFENKENINMMEKFSGYRQMVTEAVPMMEDILKSVKEKMNVTEEDLRKVDGE